MCLKFSRTSLIALMMGFYLEMSVRKGICDDRQLGYVNRSDDRAETSSSDNGTKSRQVNSWKGWQDWVPPSSSTTAYHQHEHNTPNPHIPLSPSEQAKLRSRRNRTENSRSSIKPSSTNNISTKEKTGNSQAQLLSEDLKGIGKSAMNLATSLIHQFFNYWTSSPKPSRLSRASLFGEYSEGASFGGKPEREDTRQGQAFQWLTRLIGTEGKTLGEFLREYQVHVLYDLAFTFFKWIFFLYAGLLIP